MNLLEAAVSFLGCNEKLGTHRQIIDLYNTLNPLPRKYKVKYTDKWCMTFVSACAVKAGKHNMFPYECSCQQAIEKLIAYGLWVENDAYIPEPMDLIFYHWGHTEDKDCIHNPNHVGIVGYRDNDGLHIIEGNYQDSVKWRIIPVNYKYIRGYGITSNLYSLLDNNIIAQQVRSGLWGNNPERRIKLAQCGYNPDAIQAIVNNLIEHENPEDNDKSVMDIALECIKGNWGNNPERRERLMNAGYNPDAVQEIINNYYRKEMKE